MIRFYLSKIAHTILKKSQYCINLKYVILDLTISKYQI